MHTSFSQSSQNPRLNPETLLIINKIDNFNATAIFVQCSYEQLLQYNKSVSQLNAASDGRIELLIVSLTHNRI